jgi:proteasome assembly chaperone 2
LGIPQIQYISTSKPDGTDDTCDQLGWKKLEQAGQLLQHQAAQSEEGTPLEVVLTDENFYAGLPFASLYFACKARGLKVVCILQYCSEGDNIPDAFFVNESLHQFLRQKQGENPGNVQWRIPLSWETVYGPPPDDSIF